MFLNMKQFEEVGFFDKNFFIYLEEIDLCKRLKKNGKKIYLDKNIIIHHLGGKSHNQSVEFEMELSRNCTGCGQPFISIKTLWIPFFNSQSKWKIIYINI